MRALNSTESDSPRRQPGWAARAGDGFPAHRQWRCACLGPAPSPRHSELRQAAPRALSRMALLVGASRCSPRLAERRPRRSRARSAPWASAPAKERAPSCPRGLARLALPRAQTHQLDQRRCRQSHSIAKHSSVRRLQLLPARALRHRSAAVAAHGELRLFMRSARSRGCCWCTRARTAVSHRPQPRLQRSRRSRWLREPCDARGAAVGLRGPAQLTPAPPGRYGAPARAVSRAVPLAGLVRADQRQAENEDHGAGPDDLHHGPIDFRWSGPARSGANPDQDQDQDQDPVAEEDRTRTRTRTSRTTAMWLGPIEQDQERCYRTLELAIIAPF